jgi:hypothetical protein
VESDLRAGGLVPASCDDRPAIAFPQFITPVTARGPSFCRSPAQRGKARAAPPKLF